MDKIQKMMTLLDISKEEAKQLVEDDKKIDRGEKLFELSPEQEKASKKARQSGRKPTVYKFDTKKKKTKNEDKENLISLLKSALEENEIENVNVANPEREFSFEFNGVGYKVVLSVPRGKK